MNTAGTACAKLCKLIPFREIPSHCQLLLVDLLTALLSHFLAGVLVVVELRVGVLVVLGHQV